MKRCAIAFSDDPVSRAQVAVVEAAITDLFVQLTIEGIPVAPSSDTEGSLDSLVGKLDSGEADLAVIGASRLTSRLPAGVRIAAALRRSDPRYRLVGHGALGLNTIPPGSSIACPDASVRAQILHLRPDVIARCHRLTPIALVDGVRSGDWSAALLPSGTLERSVPWGLQVQPVDTGRLQPVPGSGLIVLLSRLGKSPREKQAAAFDHALSRSLFDAERAFLREWRIEASPIASPFARIVDGKVHVSAFASDEEGVHLHRAQAEGDPGDSAAVGAAAAQRLLHKVSAAPSFLRASSL